MTDKERLQKAIEKAKKNNPRLIYNIHLLSDKGWEEITKYYQIYIFNHDFAKAFWKVDANKIKWDPGNAYADHNGYVYGENIEEWVYHLQQMVLEKEPLKYIEKFL